MILIQLSCILHFTGGTRRSNLMLMEHYFNIKYELPQTISCNDRMMKINIFYHHQSYIRYNDLDDQLHD